MIISPVSAGSCTRAISEPCRPATLARPMSARTYADRLRPPRRYCLKAAAGRGFRLGSAYDGRGAAAARDVSRCRWCLSPWPRYRTPCRKAPARPSPMLAGASTGERAATMAKHAIAANPVTLPEADRECASSCASDAGPNDAQPSAATLDRSARRAASRLTGPFVPNPTDRLRRSSRIAVAIRIPASLECRAGSRYHVRKESPEMDSQPQQRPHEHAAERAVGHRDQRAVDGAPHDDAGRQGEP